MLIAWIETYSGCTCKNVSMTKLALFGICEIHGTRVIETRKVENYSGTMGHFAGDSE